MNHRSAALLSVGIGSVVILTLFFLVSTPAAAAPQEKITNCHRTNSVSNPYNQDTVNENSIMKPDGTPHW